MSQAAGSSKKNNAEVIYQVPKDMQVSRAMAKRDTSVELLQGDVLNAYVRSGFARTTSTSPRVLVLIREVRKRDGATKYVFKAPSLAQLVKRGRVLSKRTMR